MSYSIDYYQILHISPSATQEEIKKSFLTLVKMIHPDRFDPATEHAEHQLATTMMKELLEANRVISDSEARKRYDNSLIQVMREDPQGKPTTMPSPAPPTPAPQRSTAPSPSPFPPAPKPPQPPSPPPKPPSPVPSAPRPPQAPTQQITNHSPLSKAEYNEFRHLNTIDDNTLERRGLKRRFLELKFRYMLHLGKAYSRY